MDCAALMASHSSEDTTATRLPRVMTLAPGNEAVSSLPTDCKVDPKVAGLTMRAWSMPGKRTSQLQCVLPVTLSGIPGTGNEVPINLKSFTGFNGGSPDTVSPSRELIPTQAAGSARAVRPVTGIF